MKRINPDTGKPFKIGDPRPKSDIQDGKVFGGYYTSLYKERPNSGEYFEEFAKAEMASIFYWLKNFST